MVRCYRLVMAELDHLIFASRDIDEGAALIEGLTGTLAVPGGPHVGLGTHNHLLTFDERTYFEIIGIDPDQPDPAHPRPFGLDRQERPVLAGYAIHPSEGETLEDVVATMNAAGFDPGPIAEMSRAKPDGELITWRLTRGGDRADDSGGLDTALPFAIDWGDQPSPATTLPSMGSLTRLTVTHHDAAVRAMVDALNLGVITREGPTGLMASIESKNGPVELS